MIIKIERSGGVTGIPISKQVNVQELPPTLAITAKNLMLKIKSTSLTSKSAPKGAADHYTYKISIQDGVKLKVIECDQYSIQKDLKSLINHIERI